MTSANVVGVHGISQQQSGRHQLVPLWQNALRDGVERAAGRDGPAVELDLGYYADLYIEATPTKGIEAVTLGELDQDEVGFFRDVEAQVVDEKPPEDATKGFRELPRPVGRLAAWLDRKFGVAGRALFFGDLVQVRRYQRDDELAAGVRRRVGEAIDPETRVLIGHSLGSVVAYEYLCLESGHGVEGLITLGSPLALRSVQDALRTAGADGRPMFPPGVKQWVNVLDPNDPVACGGGLSATWAAVTDEVVDNEREPHAATRYLGKRQTGDAVVASLQA